MTLLKILFIFITEPFNFKILHKPEKLHRMVSIQLSSDGKNDDVILWGMATEKGLEMLRPNELNNK